MATAGADTGPSWLHGCSVDHVTVRARLIHRAERCQFEESPLERRQVIRWARAAVVWGGRLRTGPVACGAASRFAEGDWARVKDRADIRTTLDPANKTRGLLFTDDQWSYCGGTYRIARVVRRMLDDNRRMRPISRAVVLDDVTCDGADGTRGCGRSCALVFKDEWLEHAPAPTAPPPKPSRARVRIKSIDLIRATLGSDGRLDGMSPPPGCTELAGTVQDVARTWDITVAAPSVLRQDPAARWYILDGLRCDGTVLGPDAPCDRWCPLLWHEAWLWTSPR